MTEDQDQAPNTGVPAEIAKAYADKRAADAERGAAALRQYAGTDGEVDESAACDLLADLMHLADRDGWDFDGDLERARRHHDAERDPSRDLAQGGPIL